MQKNKKILVLGAGGELGTAITKTLREKKIITFSFSKESLDIMDSVNVLKKIKELQITHIVNCAAFTDVDKAEISPENMEINFHAVEKLADICWITGIFLVQISTDYVFSSDTSNYFQTWSEMNPVNEYGRAKMLAEDALRKRIPNQLWIVRTSWLYGNRNKSFITKFLSNYNKPEIPVVNDQYGQPTYSENLSNAVYNLINSELPSGTIHLSTKDYVSRYEFAKEICRLLSISSKKLIPCKSSDFVSQALRPKYSLLEINEESKFIMDKDSNWNVELDKYLKENKSHLSKLIMSQ